MGERFDAGEPVEHDRTVSRAIDQIPHPAFERPRAAQKVREALAIAGASFVDGALFAVEEYTTTFGAFEDGLAVLAGRRVLGEKALLGDAEEAGELFNVAVDDLDLGYAATFGASAAVDRGLDLFGGAAELALDEGVGLDPLAEAEVFGAQLFAFAADLDEVGDHLLNGTV